MSGRWGRRLTLLGVLAVVVGACLWVRTEYVESKDRRDLYDLTAGAPWPRTELLVPDDMTGDDAMGSMDNHGFTVIAGQVEYRMIAPFPNGDIFDGENCRRAMRNLTYACTDLGDGFMKVEKLDTFNSDPSLGVDLYREDRVFLARTITPGAAEADRLRGLLTRAHTPSDEEFLRLMRGPGR